MRFDPQTLRAATPELAPPARFRVAFSGGLDSTVLLHALVAAGAHPLSAVHIHHGLQPAADAWVEHCTRACEALGVMLDVRRVHVADDGRGPEAAARSARYAAFAAVMRPGDCLVVAHHQDDQAETVLLRLLRGAGTTGLAGMRPLVPFAGGQLWRPLLGWPRAALRAWAEDRGLSWVEDPQNQDRRFRRVWVRHNVLPLLETEQPAVRQALARTAATLAADADVLHELATADLEGLRRGPAVSISGLRKLSAARRHNALRAWLRGRNLGTPSAALLGRVDRELLLAQADTQPLVRFPGCELRRYRDGLYAGAPLPPPPGPERLCWNGSAALVLPPGCGVLRGERAPPEALGVGFQHGGERVLPAGSRHHRPLKHLFQEAGVPPWQRRRTPLLYCAGELVWVPGVALTAAWQKTCAASGWCAVWEAPAWVAESASGGVAFEGSQRIS
ncbi:MAG TPA: tRNA lysidine(34) synthetase TilS [Nevskiaceae bacterium]|nr:tRNA lysidine(34) synthetase TilS [Nevskiaceae bacterium]